MATTKKKKSNTTSTTTTASAASTQINTQKTVTLQDIPFIKYLKSRPNSGKTVTSMKMAVLLNQQHNHLLKAIRQQIDYMVAYNDECIRTGKEDEKLNIQEYFIPSEYIDANNQKRPCYNITVIGYEYLILKQQSKNNFIFLLQYIKNFDSTLNSYKQLLDVFNLQNEQYSNKTVIEKLDALSEKVDNYFSNVKLNNDSVYNTTYNVIKSNPVSTTNQSDIKKIGRPITKNIKETCRNINVAVPTTLLEQWEEVKIIHGSNLTEYITKLIKKDMAANYMKYQGLANKLHNL